MLIYPYTFLKASFCLHLLFLHKTKLFILNMFTNLKHYKKNIIQAIEQYYIKYTVQYQTQFSKFEQFELVKYLIQ